MLVRIHVDGGSWWPSGGSLLRAGVYETDDPTLVAQALEAEQQFPWITVQRLEEEPAVPEATPPETVPPTEAPSVVLTPPTDPDGTGPLTTDDLKPDEHKLTCNVCNDGRVFATTAALVSHRRNKHPELDASTGIPLPPPADTVPAGQPNEDDLKTVDGGESQEPGLPPEPAPPVPEVTE